MAEEIIDEEMRKEKRGLQAKKDGRRLKNHSKVSQNVTHFFTLLYVKELDFTSFPTPVIKKKKYKLSETNRVTWFTNFLFIYIKCKTFWLHDKNLRYMLNSRLRSQIQPAIASGVAL